MYSRAILRPPASQPPVSVIPLRFPSPKKPFPLSDKTKDVVAPIGHPMIVGSQNASGQSSLALGDPNRAVRFVNRANKLATVAFTVARPVSAPFPFSLPLPLPVRGRQDLEPLDVAPAADPGVHRAGRLRAWVGRRMQSARKRPVARCASVERKNAINTEPTGPDG